MCWSRLTSSAGQTSLSRPVTELALNMIVRYAFLINVAWICQDPYGKYSISILPLFVCKEIYKNSQVLIMNKKKKENSLFQIKAWFASGRLAGSTLSLLQCCISMPGWSGAWWRCSWLFKFGKPWKRSNMYVILAYVLHVKLCLFFFFNWQIRLMFICCFLSTAVQASQSSLCLSAALTANSLEQ